LHPFDIKAALLRKHAQHVVLIHFPIALFIAGVAAYFNFTFAALSTIPVVITGIAAWQWALEGQRLKGILLEHLVLGCASSVLIWIVFLIHRRARQKPEPAISSVRIAIELLGVLLVGLTGHLGGFLSGVNGPG
jgi:uncharacterized membrane protein